ncbi:hypothetical protein ACT3UQ_07145 [Glutamicibacter sp. AOP12-B1-11]
MQHMLQALSCGGTTWTTRQAEPEFYKRIFLPYDAGAWFLKAWRGEQ